MEDEVLVNKLPPSGTLSSKSPTPMFQQESGESTTADGEQKGPPQDYQYKRPSLPSNFFKFPVRARMKAIHQFISSFEYRQSRETNFNAQKTRPLARIMETAKMMVYHPQPIKCVEAVFLALYLTAGIVDAERIPLSFKSELNGQVHQHIVLLVKYNNRFGAYGISRQHDLMNKEFDFDCISDIVDNYRKAYEQSGHMVLRIRVGLPVEHNVNSFNFVCWRHLSIDPSTTSWEQCSQALERHVAQAPKLWNRWLLEGQRENKTADKFLKNVEFLPETSLSGLRRYSSLSSPNLMSKKATDRSTDAEESEILINGPPLMRSLSPIIRDGRRNSDITSRSQVTRSLNEVIPTLRSGRRYSDVARSLSEAIPTLKNVTRSSGAPTVKDVRRNSDVARSLSVGAATLRDRRSPDVSRPSSARGGRRSSDVVRSSSVVSVRRNSDVTRSVSVAAPTIKDGRRNSDVPKTSIVAAPTPRERRSVDVTGSLSRGTSLKDGRQSPDVRRSSNTSAPRERWQISGGSRSLSSDLPRSLLNMSPPVPILKDAARRSSVDTTSMVRPSSVDTTSFVRRSSVDTTSLVRRSSVDTTSVSVGGAAPNVRRNSVDTTSVSVGASILKDASRSPDETRSVSVGPSILRRNSDVEKQRRNSRKSIVKFYDLELVTSESNKDEKKPRVSFQKKSTSKSRVTKDDITAMPFDILSSHKIHLKENVPRTA